MQHQSRKKVAIVVNLASRAGNMKLSGVYRYLQGSMPWDLRLIPSSVPLTSEQAAETCIWADGVILMMQISKDRLSVLRQNRTPTVTVDFTEKGLRRYSSIRIDSATIAEAAIGHFESRGQFASYAFLSDGENSLWSKYRHLAYRRALSSRGLHLVHLASTPALADRLEQLPKPAAVLAADDKTAMSLIQACQARKLDIPGSVAILGIDNDERFALATHPTISSIEPDYEREGFEAAKALHSLMNRPNRTCPPVRCGINTVFVRESSAFQSPSLSLVRRVENYIRHHFNEISGPDHLAMQLNVSRSLIDLRLRELHRPPVAAQLRDLRLEKLKSLLKSDSASIDALSRKCGFTNANWAKTLFRRKFGMSMRQWRNSPSLPVLVPGQDH